jgi:hypothetical protein
VGPGLPVTPTRPTAWAAGGGPGEQVHLNFSPQVVSSWERLRGPSWIPPDLPFSLFVSAWSKFRAQTCLFSHLSHISGRRPRRVQEGFATR